MPQDTVTCKMTMIRRSVNRLIGLPVRPIG